jgi:hypothetical protein
MYVCPSYRRQSRAQMEGEMYAMMNSAWNSLVTFCGSRGCSTAGIAPNSALTGDQTTEATAVEG